LEEKLTGVDSLQRPASVIGIALVIARIWSEKDYVVYD
jgi:hypothetical protein